jgi:hypothetical protein
MLFKRVSPRTKAKPRGRSFTKGNKRGKPDGSVLDAKGRGISIERETLTQKECESMKETKTAENVAAFIPETPVLNPPKENPPEEKQILESKPEQVLDVLEVVDSLDFKDDKGNTLKIIYRSTPARRYRLQIFLNESQEIRPVTYNGTSTSMAFWSMLKGNLKK